MSSVIVRKIGSVPDRTSSDTWRAVVALVAKPGSPAEQELLAVTGLAAMMIADENSRSAPIIVTPTSGARVRVYTVHGDDAADAVESETPLAFWPADGDNWTLSMPCQSADLEMARGALGSATHVVVRDVALGIALDDAEAVSLSTKSVEVAQSDDLAVDTSWLAS